MTSSFKKEGGPTRRTVLGCTAALALSPFPASAAATDVHLFVGSMNSAKGPGLCPLTLRPSTDEWSLGTTVADVENASFGVYSRRYGLHYLLDEQEQGHIDVYRAGVSGERWSRMGEVSSHGSGPCYISLDRAESCLVAANYNSGNVVFYRLDPATGLPIEPPVVLQDAGHGPNPDRQAGPHAHWARFSPDQRFLYSVDLGTDEILGCAFDQRRASLGERFIAFQAAPGSGPRHMAFHPRFPLAYLVSEIGNTVTALRRLRDGRLAQFQVLSTLPADFTGHNQAAHIAMNRAGDRLYVSNRGHNSLTVFAIDPAGHLKLIQRTPTLGDWPRFFLLLEDHAKLIVANQRSGDLVLFRISPDGTVHPAGKTLLVREAVYIGRVS